jgi:hypothetical protein
MPFVRAYPRDTQEMVFDPPTGHMQSLHLRQPEDRGRDHLRGQGSSLPSLLPADVEPNPVIFV